MTARPRIARRTVLVLTALLPCACRVEEVPRPERVSPGELAREQISLTLDAFRDALVNGDAGAASAAFVDEAVWSAPNAADAVGAAAIRAALDRLFADGDITDVMLERAHVDLAENGVAAEWGTFEQTVQLPEQPPATRSGRYAIRWRRMPDARWRIEQMLYNPYPPDTTATR